MTNGKNQRVYKKHSVWIDPYIKIPYIVLEDLDKTLIVCSFDKPEHVYSWPKTICERDQFLRELTPLEKELL